MKHFLLLLIALSASSQLFSQETRYILDEMHAPLRSGQSVQHRIVHKGVVSGTAVTLLEMSDDKTYSKVKTKGGTEGWIQTRYLSTVPSGRDLYNAAKKTTANLQQKNIDLNTQIKALKGSLATTQKQLKSVNTSSKKQGEKLLEIQTISANAIQLNSDNQRLLEENQALKNEVDVLNTDNQRLEDNDENDAFLNGAFAVLIGVMLTLLIPRLWPSKRTDWA